MAFPAPTLTPPMLENFQWHYNGLTIGANTAWGMLKAEGLDLGSVGSGDLSWPRDHGQAAGLDLLDSKDIILDLWVKTDGISLQDAQVQLATATGVRPNEELPLWFQLPNLPLLCVMCRPRKRSTRIDSDYAATMVARPELLLHATDPRIYGAGQSAVVTLTKPKGGLAFPVGFPATFSSITPSVVTVANGNMESRPIVIFSGPLTNPAIENASIEGQPFLKIVNPDDTAGSVFTIRAGDQVLLDTATPHRLLYYVGGVTAGTVPSDLASWLTSTSTWWDLLPGSNTLHFYSADAVDTGGTATVQWAPAYEL